LPIPGKPLEDSGRGERKRGERHGFPPLHGTLLEGQRIPRRFPVCDLLSYDMAYYVLG